MQIDHSVRPGRHGDKTYRVEYRRLSGQHDPRTGQWGLFPLTERVNEGHWEPGMGASFVYASTARHVAQARSRRKPLFEYRVVSVVTGSVRETYRDGQLVAHHKAAEERGGMATYYRADWYVSDESRWRSDRSYREGRYASAEHESRWHKGVPKVDLASAEKLYADWIRDEGDAFYKRARLVEVDSSGNITRVIRQSDTDDDSGLGEAQAQFAGEGILATMQTNINVAAEPLLVPRTTIIQKLNEQDDRLRAAHEEKQQELATEYQAKLAKIDGINQFLILAMVEAYVGKVTQYDDAAAVRKALEDRFGHEPGTKEYETPKDLAGLRSVMEAATSTDDVPVVPSNDLYKYIAVPSDETEAPSE